VSDLPTQLVAAFRATLEEVIDADLILHVRDIAHSDSEAQRTDVLSVLSEIGAGGAGGAPVIEAWNKADLVDPEALLRFENEAGRRDDVAVCSALSGAGLGALRTLLAVRLTAANRVRRINLGAGEGAAIAWLHAHGRIEEERRADDQLTFIVRLSDADYARFQTRDLA
jgi:GTP-binding protein HflX